MSLSIRVVALTSLCVGGTLVSIVGLLVYNRCTAPVVLVDRGVSTCLVTFSDAAHNLIAALTTKEQALTQAIAVQRLVLKHCRQKKATRITIKKERKKLNELCQELRNTQYTSHHLRQPLRVTRRC